MQGIESANRAQMQAGTARHLAHGRAVQRADSLRRVARAMLLLALFFAAALFLAALAALR